MALITCKECNNQVSDQAFKCPKCGAQLRKPKRTVMGKIIKWIFILFNLLMILWIVDGVSSTSDAYNAAQSSAEQAGTAIGASLGIGILLFLWVVGDFLLGIFVFLTRPKS